MKYIMGTGLLAVAILLSPPLGRCAGYDLEASYEYFNGYLKECIEQLKEVQNELQKYQNDNQKYEVYLDLSYALEISSLKVADLRNMYYLYSHMKNCATQNEKKFIFLRGMQLIDYFVKDQKIDIAKTKLKYLQDNKMRTEYAHWDRYLKRLLGLCSFVETSLNENFK